MNPHRGLPEDITEAYYRGLMHSVGYRRKDLDKPQIVVVNSWTDVNPGHQPLRELALRVKEGIWAGGCRGQKAQPPGAGNAGGVPENGRQRRLRRHLAVTGAEPAERPR